MLKGRGSKLAFRGRELSGTDYHAGNVRECFQGQHLGRQVRVADLPASKSLPVTGMLNTFPSTKELKKLNHNYTFML